MSEVNYIVVTHLLPQDATLEEWLYVAAAAFEQRQSIVLSADDAKRLVAAGLPGSKVIVWGAPRWTSGDIVAWLGVDCELRTFPASLPLTYNSVSLSGFVAVCRTQRRRHPARRDATTKFQPNTRLNGRTRTLRSA